MSAITSKDFTPLPKERDMTDVIVRPSVSYWKDVFRRIRSDKVAVVSFTFILLISLMAIFAPIVCQYGYDTTSMGQGNLSPSSEHWFGTDSLGRDLFARTCIGARVSLLVALCCTCVQIVVGSIYGGVMAYFGGKVDALMMRIIEVMMSLPYLLVVIIVMLVLGNSIFGLLVALCVTSWCNTARAVRGVVLQLKTSEYVMAARTLGASPARVIAKHLLPNTMSILILNTATSIPNYIFQESTLSFLGMGLQPPDTSLGVLISLGQAAMEFYPSQLVFPAVILVLIVLSFNLLGDGLRDALDPKLRK